MIDMRPSDTNEIAEAWRVIMPIHHDPAQRWVNTAPWVASASRGVERWST
jgi:hypothetical protein